VCQSDCSLFPHHFHELSLCDEDQSACGTGSNACRNLEVLASIAFDCLSDLRVPTYDSVGADHRTHPASHAVLLIAIDDARFWVLSHGPGAADRDARSVLAVSADQGNSLSFRGLHVDPANRPWLLGDCGKQILAGGMLDSTCHLAGPAAHASIQSDEDFFFHGITLQPQFLSLAVNVLDHEHRSLERIWLYCEARAHHIFSSRCQESGYSRASEDGRHGAENCEHS